MSETVEDIRRRMLERPGRSAAQAFWISQGEHHIKPDVGLEFPEGFDVGHALKEALGSYERVLEVGCGVGRLAALFHPSDYVGADINPAAIAIARGRLARHEFRLHDIGMEFPEADTVLFYNVLLHVPDDEICDRLEEASVGRKRIVIAEMMDRRWRLGGDPPVCNRDPEEYVDIMRSLGFKESQRITRICQRYNTSPWTDIAPPDCTLLTCEELSAGQ